MERFNQKKFKKCFIQNTRPVFQDLSVSINLKIFSKTPDSARTCPNGYSGEWSGEC